MREALLLSAGQVRCAAEKDLDEIVEIECLSFEVPWTRRLFEPTLKHLFLVYEDARVLGYILAVLCPKHLKAVIMKVATHPEYRNLGIGSALLDSTIEVLKERNMREVCLEVEMNRSPAIRLYEKYDFKITGSFRMGYEEESFHTMTLTLARDPPEEHP